MELFQLLGTIAIDNSKANAEIDETTGMAQKSESKIGAAFKKIGKVVAAAFATGVIVDFGKKCIEAAANAKALDSQFEQVFGSMEKSASESLSKVSKQTGIVESRLKGSFTQMAAFAKTTGMDTANALSLTERATLAAADSAAYYDKSIEDVTENLQSFLKGNFENDAALGLSCTETTRNAAANKLYGKSFVELSESQKQLTLLQMVEDANKLSGAMGQAAREADGWENVTGNLKASLNQLMVTIGSPLLSAAVPVVKALADGFVGLNAKVSAFLNESGIIDKLKEIAGVLIPAFKEAYDNFLKPTLDIIVSILTKILIPVLLTVIETAAKVCSSVINFFVKIKNGITSAVNSVKSVVQNGFNLVKSYIINPINSAYSTVSSVFSKIYNTISDKIGKARDFVKTAINKMNSFFNFTWSLPKIKLPHFSISGKFSLNPPSIPKFSVEWYKKGAVLTQPTIFGTNPETGNVMAGGEAGAEAVAPIDVLQSYVAQAVQGENAAVVSKIDELIALLTVMLQQIIDSNGQSITIDGKTLIGWIDKKMAQNQSLQMRGV